jgi:hypothetical protein
MPAMLAFAISDNWTMMAWVLGVFMALEIMCINVLEPWLYGRSAGLAPMAIIVSALFWTWLWGPLGLLLATPLTVCVAVMGRYVPEMGFLNTLLGVEPVLSPPARFYQRLVASDQEEAVEIAEKYVKEKNLPAFYDEVVIPALGLLERDRHRGALEAEGERSIFDHLRELLEETAAENPERPALPVCIVAAHDEADQIAGMALAAESGASLVPFPLLADELMQEIEKSGCKAICISAIPPHASTQSSYLAKRLHRRFPNLKIIVALWTDLENIERSKERLKGAGVDQVVTTFAEALLQLRDLSASPAFKEPQPRG